MNTVQRSTIISLLIVFTAVVWYPSLNRAFARYPHKIDDKSLMAAESARQKIEGKNTVNINNASVYELSRLYGIGPKLALAIIEHRDRNGRFSSCQELMQVKGIGPKKYQALRGSIKVDE
jgi:comEA protein